MITLPDGVRLRTWTAGTTDGALPVLMINGGPGLPSYLQDVAALVDDLTAVTRYDQRGTGGSPGDGPFTVAGQVADVLDLLDALGHPRAVLVGHSYGTDLACQVLIARPERVAGLVLLAGPFTEPWRAETRATEHARRSPAQRRRLAELDALPHRTEDEETEFLAQSWFTDHADPERAWTWALESARIQRPVNYAMNAQLNADKKTVPLEDRIEVLRRLLPAGSMIIGGAGDPRPASALRRIGAALRCEVVIIDGAGHDPWLERPDAFRSAFRTAVSRLVRPASGI